MNNTPLKLPDRAVRTACIRLQLATHWMLLLILWLTRFSAPAQPLPTNPAPRVYRDRINPHWFASAGGTTNCFWYRLNLADNQTEFVLVDAVKGTRSPAFDHARLAGLLAQETGKPVEATRLDLNGLEFSPDEKTVSFGMARTAWRLDLASYTLTRSRAAAAPEESLPAGRMIHNSPASEAGTSIIFVNQLAQAVDIFWINDSGQRQPYGGLAAGDSKEQPTYVGHVWLVAAKNGDVLAVFDAVAGPGRAVVGNQAEVTPRKDKKNPAPPATDSARSPDGKWEVRVRGDDLFLRNAASGHEDRLTSDANSKNSYARNAQADRAIEMNYDRRDPEQPLPEVYWSPDSSHFVAMKHLPGSPRRIYMVQSSPEDQLQPKLVSYPYLKPGDDVPYAKPHLFDVAAKNEISVDDALFANPWSISEVRWNPDSSRFTFLFNQRGHQALRILGVAAKTGLVQPIVDEASKTFICYSGKCFTEYLDDTGEIIWMSERDGWNHLYLYDAKTGRVKNQVTKGEWVVRGVDRVDREKRQIWFHAGGLRPAEDPYYVDYCRINFDGSGLTVLTEGDGSHSIQLSPDNRFLIDTWSRVDQPPVNELRRAADGKLICPLEKSEASELLGWRPPERFVTKGRDGVTDIYGVIWRPKNFDAVKKYPVIEYIYAGPQDSFTPKEFRTTWPLKNLTDLGFIVVQMDGMGTANRSKKFHDVCWKNLADAGFSDRILWIKAAAAKYPCLDLARVGICGTSAGGQDALRALLDHGDFYKVAVADSGCHDNRMDKIWWNEQWLGWPVDESYVRSSNVVDAHKLQGKLLLMVGEMDNNVDPASTMQVVNALVKADKDFELLDLPGAGHGVARTPYGAHRLTEFFTRTLLPQNEK